MPELPVRPSVVAIMAVRNRADSTKICLDALLSADAHEHSLTRVIVFDDGSTDDTPEILNGYGERVRRIAGDGSAYWAGGMREAEQAARSEQFDYLLWVNDDAVLEPDAVDRLVRAHREAGDDRSIVTGVMVWPDDTSQSSYGGVLQKWRGWYSFRRLPISDRPQIADAANGNLLLFPAVTFNSLGGIDPAFTHHFGDWDVTLRATRSGVPVIVAPGYHGVTPRNPVIPRGQSSGSRLAGWRAAMGPKGMPPREQILVLRRYAGLWPLQFARIYVGAFVRYFLWPRRS